MIGSGTGEVRLGDATVPVSEEATVFPSPVIEMQMLERNPAPGSEQLTPSRTEYDARTGRFRVIR